MVEFINGQDLFPVDNITMGLLTEFNSEDGIIYNDLEEENKEWYEKDWNKDDWDKENWDEGNWDKNTNEKDTHTDKGDHTDKEGDYPDKGGDYPKEKGSSSDYNYYPWATYSDKGGEAILWLIYMSGAYWVFGVGLLTMFFLGSAFYSYLWLVATWNLVEFFMGYGDIGSWFAYPFRRAVVGSMIIFPTALVNALIPGWGYLTSWALGIWAVADYYDYSWDYGKGPLPPA